MIATWESRGEAKNDKLKMAIIVNHALIIFAVIGAQWTNMLEYASEADS